MTAHDWSRVYLASPIPTYWTRRYDRHLEHLCLLAPAADIVEPSRLGWDSESWLAEGREVIATCDALVAFGLPGDIIGRGVARELGWAAELGVPTWQLTSSGKLLPEPVAVRLPGESWQRWAVLKRPGRAA